MVDATAKTPKSKHMSDSDMHRFLQLMEIDKMKRVALKAALFRNRVKASAVETKFRESQQIKSTKHPTWKKKGRTFMDDPGSSQGVSPHSFLPQN